MSSRARRVVVVGTNNDQTTVRVHERSVARTLASGLDEVVCLSTSGRTELYVADDDVVKAITRAELVLRSVCGRLGPDLYVKADGEAVRHLLEVSHEEGRERLRSAHAAGLTGPRLDGLFAHALRGARPVLPETRAA